MWMRAPDIEGDHRFYFMFFYENAGINLDGAAAVGVLKYYRVSSFEMSIRTRQSVNCTRISIVNSQVDASLILNLELCNPKQAVSLIFL